MKIDTPRVTFKDRFYLKLLTIEQVEAYLTKKGWTPTGDSKDGKYSLWEHFNENRFLVRVPKDRDNEEHYATKMSEIIFGCESQENRSQLEIWAQMAKVRIKFTQAIPRKSKNAA